MQFELDEDRALLKAATRELLEKESALADSRTVMEESPAGYEKALYAQLGELGYGSLLLPEEEGGMGVRAFAAVLSEMGRVAFPGPFLDLVLAVRALADCDGAGAADWKERAARCEALVVLARSEGGGSQEPEVATRFEDGRVRGSKHFVPFGSHADALLVSTREGLALVARPDAGWNAVALPTIHHAQRFAEIVLDDEATLVADEQRASEILAEIDSLAAVGAAAVMLGLMERSLETTVAYTMESSNRIRFRARLGNKRK